MKAILYLTLFFSLLACNFATSEKEKNNRLYYLSYKMNGRIDTVPYKIDYNNKIPVNCRLLYSMNFSYNDKNHRY